MKPSIRRAAAVFLAALALIILRISPASAETYYGTVNANQVFLRMAANRDSDCYGKLDKGTKVTLLGVRGDFFKVKYQTFTGYMMQKFIDAPSSALRAFGASSTTSYSKYQNARSVSALGDAPSPSYKGASGDNVAKLQAALKIKGYYSGAIDGDYGQGTADAVLAYQRKAGISATGTATSSTIRALFGTSGTSVAVKDDPAMSGVTRISQIETPNTSKPGMSGKHVKALQQALKLKGYYKAGVDSSYGDLTVEAVRRFQKAVGLGADGIAGFATIRKLFGESAANYTILTERLDWFRNGSATIPKGAVFQVKDVATGRVFTARRWSGGNHVDAEPVSDDDGATLRAVSGGYSWRRRAVLVKIGGHVYAGSINTMPHGTDTVPGNEFDGHFCIHFYKSKTHGTDRVDEAHQDAVARAMRATW